MIQCKRFRWEDEFNEWARKENIQGHQVIDIKPSPPDSMIIFYDKSLKEKTSTPLYYYGYTYDWATPQWTSTTTTDRTVTVNKQPNNSLNTTTTTVNPNTVTTAYN